MTTKDPQVEELKRKYGRKAEVSVQAGYDIVINWDAKAKRRKLLKVVPHEGVTEVVLKVEELVSTIIDNFTVEHMYAMEANTKSIDMIEVERTIKGTCTQEYKVGDEISFNYAHHMPLEHAIAEQALKVSSIAGDTVRTITLEELQQAAKDITKSITEYNQHLHAAWLKRQEATKTESIEEQ